ncbi:Ger(x)C family spore germination protein [Aquibacillus sediminis]|uniref:Ger(x)C family spore germination protein n=1 Tax=Aquibacillus sediminis TaxID=2574734 RepID=UPI001107DC33|nr:Ger(x)C family spore germination protein [Aquibacillus sediminis]
MRKLKYSLLLSLITLLLTGCYDKTELEQQAYVVAIGVDKGEKENTYDLTYQIANPEVGSSITGGSSDEAPFELVTVQGIDFMTATATANSFVAKNITLDHTKVLFVSEELARSESFLRGMQGASRTSEIRRQVNIVVTKEDTRTFIETNQPQLETRPHKYYQLMLGRSTETGIVPQSTIHRFFQLTEGDADLFLAMYATTQGEDDKTEGNVDEYIAGQIPKEGGNPTQFMGAAVFKEGKMIDILNGEETRIALILDNTLDMKDLLVTFQDPINKEYQVAGDLSKKDETKVEVDYKKEGPTKIDVTVPFQLEVLAVPSLIDYTNHKKHREKLKESVEGELQETADALVKKAQEEYGSDPFYWSIYIRSQFKTIEEYEQADWNKKIWPNADVTINFDMNRIEFGKMLKDSDLEEVWD